MRFLQLCIHNFLQKKAKFREKGKIGVPPLPFPAGGGNKGQTRYFSSSRTEAFRTRKKAPGVAFPAHTRQWAALTPSGSVKSA